MLVYGVDENNEVKPLLLDANGKVIVSGVESTPLDPTARYITYLNSSLPAGTSVQTAYTVPTGERLLLTCFSMMYAGTVAGVTLLGSVSDGTNIVVFAPAIAAVNGAFFAYNVNILMEATYILRCTVVGATLNDDFHVRAAFMRYK